MTDFTDEQLYGEDLIRASQRWAAPVVKQHVGRLETQVGQLTVNLARERVMAALDRDPQLGGSWRATNEDPGFLRWLNEIDQLAGERRMDLLHRAFD